MVCLALGWMSSACTPEAGGRTTEWIPRYSSPFFFTSLEPYTQLESNTVVTTETILYAYVYTYGHTGERYDSWVKVEIDLGNGTGWIDITDKTRSYYKKGAREFNALAVTYGRPGTYHVRSRTTFRGGEVVYSNSFGESTGLVVSAP